MEPQEVIDALGEETLKRLQRQLFGTPPDFQRTVLEGLMTQAKARQGLQQPAGPEVPATAQYTTPKGVGAESRVGQAPYEMPPVPSPQRIGQAQAEPSTFDRVVKGLAIFGAGLSGDPGLQRMVGGVQGQRDRASEQEQEQAYALQRLYEAERLRRTGKEYDTQAQAKALAAQEQAQITAMRGLAKTLRDQGNPQAADQMEAGANQKLDDLTKLMQFTLGVKYAEDAPSGVVTAQRNTIEQPPSVAYVNPRSPGMEFDTQGNLTVKPAPGRPMPAVTGIPEGTSQIGVEGGPTMYRLGAPEKPVVSESTALLDSYVREFSNNQYVSAKDPKVPAEIITRAREQVKADERAGRLEDRQNAIAAMQAAQANDPARQIAIQIAQQNLADKQQKADMGRNSQQNLINTMTVELPALIDKLEKKGLLSPKENMGSMAAAALRRTAASNPLTGTSDPDLARFQQIQETVLGFERNFQGVIGARFKEALGPAVRFFHNPGSAPAARSVVDLWRQQIETAVTPGTGRPGSPALQVPPAQPAQPAPVSNAAPVMPAPAPTQGRIRVQRPDGTTGTVSAGKTLPPGWKVLE